MTRLPMLDNILGQVQSLEHVLDRHTVADQGPIAECGRSLRECPGRIIVTGMGASFFAALPAAQALESGGRPVLYAEASELLHFGHGSWRKDDLAILVSRSGGSVETLELAKKFSQAGMRTIAVTNVPGSRLAANTACALEVGSDPDQLIAVQTYTGTLLALLLLAELADSPPTQNVAQQCRASLPALAKHIEVCLEQSEAWQPFLLGSGPLYLLGRGGALAATGEGALLLHETSKTSAVAMSSGQFRHGPVEVVSPGFRAIILGSPAPTRSLDWQLALDLRAMNADICWIGPDPGDPGGRVKHMPWPGLVPAALAPIFDIVPLQVAAYRTAGWRGVRAGDFRYASEITEHEVGFPLLGASLA